MEARSQDWLIVLLEPQLDDGQSARKNDRKLLGLMLPMKAVRIIMTDNRICGHIVVLLPPPFPG